jgi:hypothetical protein
MMLGKHTLAAQHTLGIFTSFTEKERQFSIGYRFLVIMFLKKYSG